MNSAIWSPILPAALLFGLPGLVSASDLAERLEAHEGKRITLVLGSGIELSGKLVEAGDGVAVLSELSGKEFFDAVVDLDDVEAVVYRVRDR